MEEMMDNFEAYIEETRGQFEDTKANMQQQAATIDDLIKRVEATEANAKAAVAVLRTTEKAVEQKKEAPAAGSASGEETGRRSTRQDAVRDLLARGMTVEQIAQKLELSINEVRLVVYGLMAKNTGHK
jgi:DNA-binding NarL/FixJ family response regulator